jgi:hypothetical protein
LGGTGVVIMLAVVVYESLLGNTRRVAEAVAGGIRDAHPQARLSCGTPGEVGADAATAELLVVGAPTHFFGLPSRRSRRLWTRGYQRAGDAGASKPPLEAGAGGPGVREWLDELPAVEQGRLAAAFDTRLRRATSGAAARRMARRLRRAATGSPHRQQASSSMTCRDRSIAASSNGSERGGQNWWHNGSPERRPRSPTRRQRHE